MRNGQELLEEFKSVRREARKLEIALELFQPGMDFQEEVREEFLRYLLWRKRPAVQYLIRTGDLVRLRRIEKLGWLEKQYLESYRELAIQSRETEIWSWLVRLGRETESTPAAGAPENGNILPADAGAEAGTEEADTGSDFSEPSLRSVPSGETALSEPERMQRKTSLEEKVWELTVRNLRMKLPGLSEALGTLKFQADPKTDYIACDGFTVWYQPEELLRHYRQNAKGMERDLLHLILHNMYLHPLLMRDRSRRHWDLACDLTIERILDSWKIKGLERPGADFRSYQLKELRLPRRWTGAEAIYEVLMERYPDPEPLQQLEKLYRIDDHRKWERFRPKKDEDFRKTSGEGEEGQAGEGDGRAFMNTWDRLRREWNPQAGEEHSRAGNQAGSNVQKPAVSRKRTYDYRHFLEEFMVCQEEVELDLDSIDYLPYWYSRNHYRDIVLIEPLEYKEVHKLDEMVIAIDTSGSCSGKIVKRFLEETWSILTESGNFFKKMHVHIIQCDSAVQEHVVIHSREEFLDYMDQITVKGLGGTDFRPVFDLVQKLIDEKELLNLKGLLYFTDGDGVYPKDPPSFRTAFIFLNHTYEKQKIPEWGIRLNLGVQLEE